MLTYALVVSSILRNGSYGLNPVVVLSIFSHVGGCTKALFRNESIQKSSSQCSVLVIVICSHLAASGLYNALCVQASSTVYL